MFPNRLFWRIFLANSLTLALLTVVLLAVFSFVCEQQFATKFQVESVEVFQNQIKILQSQFTTITWVVFLSVLLLCAIISLMISSRLSGRLQQLRIATQAITEGVHDHWISVDSTDEIGELGSYFNTMNKELTTRINELKQQALQMRENSERLSTVLGGMIEGVIAVDSQDLILFANDAAFRMIEFDGRRVIGRPYWEVLRNSDVQKVVRDVISGQFQLKQEIVIPRSQARIAFIASRLPGEPCPGVVLVLHDVTELRRLEKIRSEFVSNVSHELKTPLTAIQVCTDTLCDGAIHEPKHAVHFLNQITEHSSRLHRLITDLMELAKIESEDELFQSQEIDIGIPIQEAIDEHLDVATSHGISLKYEPTIEDLIIRADSDGIRTIINNLLDNAITYTATGGKVCVKWFQKDENVVIEISDSGIGIEHKHLERIFERFYRADSARSREAGGTGLGLAIVKHLCQYFSGNISVTSEPNIGSTFVITFPLVERSPVNAQNS